MIVEKQTDPDNSSASFAFDPGTGLGAANEPNFNLSDGGQKAYDVTRAPIPSTSSPRRAGG